MRRLATVLAASALLAAPAVAHAQGGAGDDQYSDPFGGQSGQGQTQSKPKQQQSGGADNGPALSSQPPTQLSGSSGSSTSTPAPSSASSSSSTYTAPTPAPAAQSAATPGAELPYTGLDARIVALAGLLLVAAGIALRVRTVDGRRR